MENRLQIIKKSSLFSGVADEEAGAMLNCLGATQRLYAKGEYILRIGDKVDSIGLLTDGSALIVHEDFWGNRNIIDRVAVSDIFAESFACADDNTLNVAVVAEEDCAVVWLGVKKILTTCPTACQHHSRMIRNLLSELATKSLTLNQKLTHMSQRTTRDKVLSYLSAQAQERGKRQFDIPFNRQQLADYLSVERSALSAELSKLQKEGVIEFDKNHFCLM